MSHSPLHCLERWSRLKPKSIALQDMDSGRNFTYRELFERSHHLAAVLKREFSVSWGDRVALLAPNEIESVFLFFALQRLGAILVPLNWRLAPREIQGLIADAEPKLLIVHEQCESSLPNTLASLKKLKFTGPGDTLAARLFSETLEEVEAQGGLEDPAMILYTSGTSGTPKGALLTSKMIFWNALSTGMRLEISGQDSTLIFHPMFHTSGWNVLTLPFLQYGARVLFLKKFDADTVLRILKNESVSILFGVPTMMRMMADAKAFSQMEFPALRFAIVGGEPMAIPLIETWNKKEVPVRQGYGLTEFGPNVFSLNAEDAIRKSGSIGFPNHFIDVKVVTDSGQDALPGQTGELLLQGPAAMVGYWRRPEATKETLRDTWLYTGDLVRFDEEGFFYVVGRKKDMFISGAENVYPAEVEQFLSTHPKVKEVAVIGVKDEKWGEVGKAFFAPHQNQKLTADELRDFCQGNLARYKIPKYFESCSALPKSDSGKILKRSLGQGANG